MPLQCQAILRAVLVGTMLLGACEPSDSASDDAAACDPCEPDANDEGDVGGSDAGAHNDGSPDAADCLCTSMDGSTDGGIDLSDGSAADDGRVTEDVGPVHDAAIDGGMDAAGPLSDAVAPDDATGQPEAAAASDSALSDAASDGGSTASDGSTAIEAGLGLDPSLSCSFSVCPTGWKLVTERWMSPAQACVPANDPRFSCADPNARVPCSLAHATATCRSGACGIGTCASGFDDCDDTDSNGCEAPLNTASNCGSCGHSCTGDQVCANGDCLAQCPFPLTNCGGACVDLSTAVDHCGSCPTVCPVAQGNIAQCVGGSCKSVMDPAAPACGGTDLQADAYNCGMCGHACSTGYAPSICAAGTCACTDGYSLCSNTCVDLRRSPENCGGCGWACDANSRCDNGVCVSATSIRLAAGSKIESIAADEEFIYFADTDDNCVRRVPRIGGEATTIATAQAKPLSLVVDGTSVYWASNLGGAILRSAKNGGGWTVVSSASSPNYLVADQDRLYWLDSDGSVRSVRKDGSDPRTVAKIGAARGPILVDETDVYVGTSLSMARVSKASQETAGCTACVYVGGCDFIAGVAQDANNVYVACVPSLPDGASSVYKYPKSGMPGARRLSRGAGPLFVDGCFLWIGEWRVALEAQGAVRLDIGKDVTSVAVGGVDSSYIYWRTTKGIFRSVR